MSRKKIIFSKQCDHDLDLIPFWYHWYTEVFKVDTVIITPVKTGCSEISKTIEYYQNLPVKVVPLEIQKWNAEEIWNLQLEIAKKELTGQERFLALSADTDQFLEPPSDALLTSGSNPAAAIYRRVNLVSETTPTTSTLADCTLKANETDVYIAGFVDNIPHPNIGMTGHYTGFLEAEEVKTLRYEFHLQLRGKENFKEKVKHLAVDSETQWSGHWKQWRAVYDAEGEKALEAEYERWAKRFLSGTPRDDLTSRFMQYGTGEGVTEAPHRNYPEQPSSIAELPLTLQTSTGKVESIVRIPLKEMYRVEEIIQKKGYAFPFNKNPNRPLTVVDIGANVGLFAIFMKSLDARAAIHCFEPYPGNIKLLKSNTQVLDNIVVHPIALGDADAQGSLHLHRKSSGGHSLRFNHHHFENAVEVTVKAAGPMLDSLNLNHIDILKVDTEGAELSILTSLGKRLNDIDFVMVEYHTEHDRRVIDQLLSGFHLFGSAAGQINLGVLKYVNNRLLKR